LTNMETTRTHPASGPIDLELPFRDSRVGQRVRL